MCSALKKLRGNEGCRQVNITHLFIKCLLNANYVPGIVLNACNCNIWYDKKDSDHVLELSTLYMPSLTGPHTTSLWALPLYPFH